MTRTDLISALRNYGYINDAEEIADAYLSEGIEGAAAVVEDWDDDEHGYTEELRSFCCQKKHEDADLPGGPES